MVEMLFIIEASELTMAAMSAAKARPLTPFGKKIVQQPRICGIGFRRSH
jgi:hypothetical protein